MSLKDIWRRLATQRAHESKPVAPSCDVLLLVAIKAEMEALRTACADLGIAMQPKQWDPLGNYFDLGVIGADRVFAAQTTMGAIRHEGSAYKAILFRRAAQATSIIQIGMAFGSIRAAKASAMSSSHARSSRTMIASFVVEVDSQ